MGAFIITLLQVPSIKVQVPVNHNYHLLMRSMNTKGMYDVIVILISAVLIVSSHRCSGSSQVLHQEVQLQMVKEA